MYRTLEGLLPLIDLLPGSADGIDYIAEIADEYLTGEKGVTIPA
ncbi:hypothetical protein [Haloactinomyces albus]|uniref:Uncharacterized protein n=1 Tax=Haloactinomyces albus TaxID=1352928 RepID=A0AAE3ZI77_9ACTN|nr:hypothetical protein [Haloactinomyces albus]MDR7304635.1 hypothetical protein [Haloactinomyces albus]